MMDEGSFDPDLLRQELAEIGAGQPPEIRTVLS